MKTLMKNKIISTLLVAIIMGGLYFYFPQKNDVNATETAEPQAFPVAIGEVKKQKAPIWFKYSGKAVAVDYVEIKPRVAGAITAINFTEGAAVEKGDVLFIIDPRPYKAQLDIAKAELEASQTQVNLAEKEYDRAQGLISSNTISKQVLDVRSSEFLLAKANRESAKARVTKAELDLDYAHVKAPFSGKTSRAEITVGNIVESGQNAPVLTTIVSDKNIYIDFEIDERTYLKHIKNALNQNKTVPVKVNLQNSDKTEITGTILNVDNKIDINSGTIRARSLLDNAHEDLLPGMFVSIEISGNSDEEKILISEKAISTDQTRKFVWVVDKDNKTDYREVFIGSNMDGKRVILSGLEEGEKVVLDGVMKIRQGTWVTQKETPPPAEDQYSEKQ